MESERFCSEGLSTDIVPSEIHMSTIDANVAVSILDGITEGRDMSYLANEAQTIANGLRRQLASNLANSQ